MERMVTPALRLLLTFWLQAGYRGTKDLYLNLIGDAELHGLALNSNNRPEQAAGGDHLISIFQGVDHFLGLLLAALRGENQQHIKNAISPPGPPAWAIKDKFSGKENKDIASTPSCRNRQS
jgi:hypothetical protein